MKRGYKRLFPLLLVLLLLLAACAGSHTPAPAAPASTPAPALHTPTSTPTSTPPPASAPGPSPTPKATPASAPGPSPTPKATPTPAPGPSSTPTPTSAPAPTLPPGRCTLSVSCAVLLDRPDLSGSGWQELVPADGWLLPPTAVDLQEGDSVFDLLLRTCRQEGIHMEFSMTPGLGTAYIEGIGNLYEFDCGDRSGWIFAVDGISPNRGCSDVFPQSGQHIQWCYTCDLGNDLPHITRG